MSRCLLRAFCGALFLFSGAISPVLATELSTWPTTSDPVAVSEALSADTTFDRFRIELGGAALRGAISFEDEAVSPLFTAPSVSTADATGINAGNGAGADATGSEWDYLWHNASRIPITSIPEPTTASLLIGGAVLLWSRRARKPIQ
jgi:hypothetical protein